MEVILSYLENMFLNMPKTADVLRAKEELGNMMEDKFNELLAEGKKENEAIGIVISEFGDISELAEELGLSMYGEDKATQQNHMASGGAGTQGEYGAGNGAGSANVYEKAARSVSRQEAEEYMLLFVKTSKWIAAGVALCICSPICLILLGGVDESIRNLSDAELVCFGLVPLFLMIGMAVAIFIYHGMKLEKFDYLKKENIWIDSALDRELKDREDAKKQGVTIKIVIGVVICIFSVIPLLVSGSVTDHEMIHAAMVALMLALIAIAVVIFIVGGSETECIKVLRQEDEFTPEGKNSEKIMGIIGGIYWPVATVIYLGWSLITMKWGITWIVWPIAGILFGGIAAVCNVIVSAARGASSGN